MLGVDCDHAGGDIEGVGAEVELLEADEGLLEEADPASYILPGWSLLPIGEGREPGPEAAIMACY